MPSPHKKNIYSTEMANHFKMRTIMLVMFIEVEMWYFHGACDMKWAFFFLLQSCGFHHYFCLEFPLTLKIQL